MATPTTYRSYLKPATGETYDVSLLDSNYDKIDTDVNTALTGGGTVKIKHAEFLATSISNTAGAPWDIGPLVVQSGNSQNNTFCVANASSGKLDLIEVGEYTIDLVVKPRTNPGLNYVSIKDGADSYFFDLKESGASIKWENAAHATVYVPVAPVTVFFRTQWANTAICDSTIRVNKVQG